MVDVTRNVIRLGNFSDGIADIDPDGTGGAENANALVGQTYSGATMSIETVTYSDGDSDGFVDFDDTVGPGGDYVTYDLGSGPTSETVDQAVWYNVDILLADGSTLSTSALIFQTPSGETFLNEFGSNSLDNLDIQSIPPTGVNNNFFARMATGQSVDSTTVCFGLGTEILTPAGHRPVEAFQPGDLVCTTDGVPQPVVAIYRMRADTEWSERPLRFDVGALGSAMPEKPLFLTGNHRVLCASRLVMRMFGEPRVLMPAKRFIGLEAVDKDERACLSDYIHLELKTHSVILANGALVESCLLGPMVARSLPPLASSLNKTAKKRYPVPAGKAQHEFVRRLIKNGRAVVEPTEKAACFSGLSESAIDKKLLSGPGGGRLRGNRLAGSSCKERHGANI